MKGCSVFLINVYILLYTVEAQQNIYASLYKYIYLKVLSQGRMIKFVTNSFRTWTQSSMFSRHSMETFLRFAILRASFIQRNLHTYAD